MLQTSNYVIKYGESEFYINVCRSLVREEHMNCPADAAICKLTNKNGKLTNPVVRMIENCSFQWLHIKRILNKQFFICRA